jgi:UDP-N-acetylglucosamine diphosphorylase/glucosamine-1-phosphate N-acetyltransferase
MGETGLVIFDDGCPTLGPLCDLRACFDLRTGAVTTAERLARQTGQQPAGLVAGPRLAAVVGERWQLPVNTAMACSLLVNGRWTCIDQALPQRTNTALVDGDGSVLAALLDESRAAMFVSGGCTLPDDVERTTVQTESLVRHPWDVLTAAQANLAEDIAGMDHLAPVAPGPMVAKMGEHAVLATGDVTIDPFVLLDASAGPIAFDAGVRVRGHATIEGPCYVGPGTIINGRAHLRPHTIIGPGCKVGGEVSASVFQGYSNKCHAGYVGCSYVGEWANLGAGTTTSNMKNTYGVVRMKTTRDGEPLSTGMQFLGSIIGDHVKTAIGTRLMTGSCISTGAMIAVSGFAEKWVDRFAFMTDRGTMRYDLDSFCRVAARVMRRREHELTRAMVTVLADLHSVSQLNSINTFNAPPAA